MAAKGQGKIKRIAPLLWRVSLGVFTLAAVALIVLIWYSAKSETQEALSAGRRVLIRLEDGTMQGKILRSAPVKTEGEKSAEVKEGDAGTSASAEDTTQAAAPADLGDTFVNVPTETTLEGINPSLVENTKIGQLPIIAADGTKPWKYYSKPFERQGKTPMIAVIVTGLGHNKVVTDAGIKLHENVTLSFSPYSKNLVGWVGAARATGHEVLIDLPLEPSDYPATDPGPYGMIVNKGVEANESNMRMVMSRVPVYVGMLTPQNETYTADNDSFKIMLQSLANRGILLVVGREPAKNETKDIIAATTTPITVADALIDEELSESAIQTRLIALERLAQKRGHAVGVAQAYPITVEQLKLWSETLAGKGILLVPVTAVVKLRFN